MARPVPRASQRRLRTLYRVAAAGLAALVPLILFAGFWIRAELNKSHRDVEIFLTSRANDLSQRVDATIEQQLSALTAVAALPVLDGGPQTFETVGTRLLAAMPHWSVLALIDPATGRTIVSAPPDRTEAPDPEAVKRVRETKGPFVDTAPRSGDAVETIRLYVPVVRPDALPYVLMTTFDSTDIRDLAAQQSRIFKLSAAVVDRRDEVVTRSGRAAGSETSGDYRQAVSGKTIGLFQLSNRDGAPMTSAFVRSSLTGWVSVVSIGRDQIDRMSTRSVWATVAAGALSLILACILIIFIVHTMAERRVSEERLAASQALGDLDARLLSTTQEALDEQRKASSEREVLLREIYHRVKNNLQIVQSLLRLGSRDLHQDQREPFEGAIRRIGAMARVHTLLYNSPDLASIDFKDYLDELLKELSEGFGAGERSIESVLEANSMRVPLDTAVPLAFIAVEILTNSFKHAFPDNRAGRIRVTAQHDRPLGTLTIEDDGVGVTYDPAKKRRLGLTIVRKLVEQIGGTLEEPKPGSSTFVIHFPLDAEDEEESEGDRREESVSS